MATTNAGNSLEMHIFGATQGESIVLKLPAGGWGVVDCYASTLDDPADNAALHFLSERGVSELEFLCLTHPHDDHYRGMSQLLERLRVRCFWRPSAMSRQRLKWILQLALVDAKRSGHGRTLEDADELERIFTLVKQGHEQRREPLISKAAAVGTQLYPVPVDPKAHFQIWAIAPSGRRADDYEEGLRKCFDDNGRIKDRLPYARHNEISLALLVVFGRTRVILGGDVEESNWLDTLNEFGRPGLSCVGVKASHHGSTNGYCQGLWEAFAADRRPVTVVTSFQRHRLPRRDALEHIGEFAAEIVTPCLSAVCPKELPIPLSPKAPVKSRRALRDTLKARADARSMGTGCCSLTFDDSGACTVNDLQPPAGKIRFK
jgi:beta-lactamase superfamily II metal-dependent hydrolase